MAIQSKYKRSCDRCDKLIDVNSTTCVKKTKSKDYNHLCSGCVRHYLKGVKISKTRK